MKDRFDRRQDRTGPAEDPNDPRSDVGFGVIGAVIFLLAFSALVSEDAARAAANLWKRFGVVADARYRTHSRNRKASSLKAWQERPQREQRFDGVFGFERSPPAMKMTAAL
ncbi:MAG: hypothetical protein R3C40_07395 [Parvularculaceae bacterium]